MPVGLVPKMNAFWSSLKVSSRISRESVSSRSASRRFLRNDDVLRLGIEADDAEIQVAVVEDNANFRALGREFTLFGILLDEVGRNVDLLPERFGDQAVQLGRLGDPLRAERLQRRRFKLLGV